GFQEVCMPAGANPSPPETALPRILIAEDNPQGAELLEAYLSDGAYETQTAADGEETLRLVHDWRPDLILLDIMMPKISGFEVCKRLRADPTTRDIAVLMVTGLDQPSDIDKAVEAGTEDFVTKPIKKPDLLLRVRAFFRDRLAAAARLRRDVLRLDGPGRACRLVFSEGDGLSGLTVDRYDRWLVVQFTSLALAQRRDLLAELLAELTGAEGIYLRTERGIGKLEGLELHDGPLWGQTPAEAVTVE